MNYKRKELTKISNINPSSIKDVNNNLNSLFDTSLKIKKECNGFNIATKFKRNFK